MEQQKDMSLKLSNCIQAPEAPNESLVEHQVLSPRIVPHQNEKKGKNFFTGTVLNNYQFTFTAADAGFSTADHAAIAAVPKKKFKRISSIIDSDDELKTNFLQFKSIRTGFHNELTILSCF